MNVKTRWRKARGPQWNDHPWIITRKRKVLWWVAVGRFIRGA